jgi:hypothetical protein
MASDAEPLGRAYDSTPRGSFETTARSWLSLPWRMPMVLQPGPGREVRSRFDGNCHRGAPRVPVICVARDGTRSHVWTWDGRTFVPASRLDGDFYLDARSVSGWVSGWSKRRLALVAPDGARAYEVLGACTRARCVSEPVFDGHVLAGLVTEAGVTRVSTYRLRPVSSPAR